MILRKTEAYPAQGLSNFSVKGQGVNVLDFAGHLDHCDTCAHKQPKKIHEGMDVAVFP